MPQVSVGVFEALRTVNLEAQGIQAPEIPGIGRAIPIRVGPFSQFDARAFLNQEVLNFQRRYGHKAAGARLEATEAENVNTRELLALSVVVSYVTAQRSQASAATLRKQLSLSRELLTITSDRASQGVASTLDTRRAEQQANNLQQALLEAENDLVLAKLELAKLMHARISSEYELADIASFYDTNAPAEKEAMAMAFESRPDYRAAQAQVRAAELDLFCRRLRTKRQEGLSQPEYISRAGLVEYSRVSGRAYCGRCQAGREPSRKRRGFPRGGARASRDGCVERYRQTAGRSCRRHDHPRAAGSRSDDRALYDRRDG
jgi:hypothetical protein